MKKWICLIVCAVMLFSLCACGTETENGANDTPKATVFVTINTEGMGGMIGYEPGETAPEIDPEQPYQSAQINLAEAATYTFAAASESGYMFMKWTKNGEDFSTDPIITVQLDESADFVAVFEEDPDWQNPVMNFIGEYQCGSAHALVECLGYDGAWITIEQELARWDIVDRLNTDTLTIAYSGGTKSTVTYDGYGEVINQEPVYEDGTGTITFNDDGTFTWHDDKSENGTDMIFEWVSVSSTEGIDYLALVNNLNALPDGWEDALETVTVTNSLGDEVEVEARAYAAYELLRADMEENDGIYIELDSARRSVATQQDIMNRFIEKYGADYAAKTVAQPGYSEHHTGLALDLYFKLKNDDGSFTDVYYNEDMVQYPEIWEKIHAKLAKYGFILRYLKGREHITGYGYEPWHIRYLDDPAIAAEITDSDITLEEYLAGAKAPEVKIDYGTSALYTKEELDEAIVQIKCRFAAFGCELHSLTYAGDGANNADNLKWMNEFDDDNEYTQVCEFLSDFHAPENIELGWESDMEYTNWQWWLARTDDGGWQLMTWGY